MSVLSINTKRMGDLPQTIEVKTEDTMIVHTDEGMKTCTVGEFADALMNENTAVKGAVDKLNGNLAKKVKGYLINVNGTTDSAGIITVNDTSTGDFSQMPYCVTNYSRELSYPYSVTINNRTATSISFRIRKMSDNTSVGNTQVSFTALILGF